MNLDRIRWQFRRWMLARRIDGFKAHWTSYAGSNVEFSEFNSLQSRSWLWNVRLGRFTYVVGAKIKNARIGSFCSVGPEAIIGGLGVHPTSWLSTHPAFYSTLGQTNMTFANNSQQFDELPMTVVGNDVWIGCRAIILDGVSIGDGAIIAAGAVVAKDVPPYAIVGGVPAKLIRYRFSAEVVEALTAMRWWDESVEVLKKNAQLFSVREEWQQADIERLRQAICGESRVQ